MTCREKLAIEHPEKIDKFAAGGCCGCPSEYGYLHRDVRINCSCLTRDDNGMFLLPLEMIDRRCRECWDREAVGPVMDFIHKEKIHKEDIIDLEALEKTVTYDVEQIRADLKKDPDMAPFIKDSGNRREFETGAVRDIQEGKGRCDLMPLDVVAAYYSGSEFISMDACTPAWVFHHICLFQKTGKVDELIAAVKSADIFAVDSTMFLEVAKHFEEGAKKYGEYNWQKGIPVHCYIDSAVRHYLKFLRGDTDEPHDRAFVWNILCCIWTCKHKPELNDYAKKEEEEV
jgi:hypothetical protein